MLGQGGVGDLSAHRERRDPHRRQSEIAELARLAGALRRHRPAPSRDDISLVASPHVDPAAVLTPAQLTDTYLLALAVTHGGKLATLNRCLSPKPVPGGKTALHVIGG